MALICDTSGVYALYDADDARRQAIAERSSKRNPARCSCQSIFWPRSTTS